MNNSLLTYVTIGYCSNGSNIVYAGCSKEVAMNIDLYIDYDCFNVCVWKEGIMIESFFRDVNSSLGWEYFADKNILKRDESN